MSKCRFRAKDDKNCRFFKLTRHEAHRQVTIERVKLIEGATVCKWSNTRAIDLLGHLRIVAVYAKVKIFYRTTGLVKEDILPDLIPFYQTDKFWTHQQRKATFQGWCLMYLVVKTTCI